jgi:hypothetical protein
MTQALYAHMNKKKKKKRPLGENFLTVGRDFTCPKKCLIH